MPSGAHNGETLDQLLYTYWPLVVAAADVALALAATAHVVIHKRDARAAISWGGIIWLVPFLGVWLYVLLGINRIRRRAQALRGDQPEVDSPIEHPVVSAEELRARLGPQAQLAPLAALVGQVTHLELLSGNRVRPLVGGDEAYPVMIAAIEDATRSVALSSYIFDLDRIGERFVAALTAAAERRVAVRVLIDAVGARYSRGSTLRRLVRQGVPAALFLPTLVPWRLRYSNLRNHRKLLVVDGELGFTGGMNIREGTCLELAPEHPIQDLHFELGGPVVDHMQEVFAQDWAFASGELLTGERWFRALQPAGQALARGIPDGPDEDFDELRLTLLGALSCAQRSVRVMTPYFLPDASLITALNVAALRGVEVDIILPERNNLRLVQWASSALLWQVLERGCRVWLTPPPFDHTKLMLVDGVWTLLGSANWDPRSLRLNFEFNVECYDADLAGRLEELVQEKIAGARGITLADVDGRSLPVRIRDGTARLLTPFL